MLPTKPLFILTLFLAVRLPSMSAVTIEHQPGSPVLAFAAEEITDALERAELTGIDLRISLEREESTSAQAAIELGRINSPGDLIREGFSIRVFNGEGPRTIHVIGHDDAGILYGALEVAELIETRGIEAVVDTDHNPHMPLRGVKFNIPLDVRTPSYTDVSDAAQNNIATVWEWDFWTEFIDRLARQRYNFVSCWNLHPFPSLVKVPDYPDVALDDVRRSTVKWEENYSLSGVGFDAPEILGNVETLHRLTIDEKIDFWRRVMRYGKERNVHFAFVTWNVFVNGTDGKYGITDDFDNATTTDYFRKSVKQLLLTYPDLMGVGLTTGENFKGADFQEKEDWAFATYGKGVLDAAAEQPGRRIMLIHRQHMTGARDIARTFAPVLDHPDIEFVFSFKYAKAHVKSSTVQPYKDDFIKDIEDMKTLWTLRNDDAYILRWGGAGFVREFIQNIPHEVSRGFYYGSDQWIWGREFLSTEPETPRALELAKHGYHWLLWGRLGYDPTLSDDRFIAILQNQFPKTDAPKLFEAWQAASMTYPLTTGFHWGALDFQWYIEGCQSRPRSAETPSGFHDVNRFISLPPHPGTDNISIPDFVEAALGNEPTDGTTPYDVASALHQNANKALELVSEMSSRGNKELRRTLDDIRCMAYLGNYYGHKIRAATDLHFYRNTHKRKYHESVGAELREAAHFWRLYVSTLLSNYRNDPLWTNRVGFVDFRTLQDDVMYDLTITGSEKTIASMAPTAGGTILEAEDATSNGAGTDASVPGFTGDGYVDFTGSEGRRFVEWICDAPKAGTYTLEFRYLLPPREQHESELIVNGESTKEVIFWKTPTSETWAWDRKHVQLRQGENRIRVYPGGAPKIDHLNVLPVY